jgi:hypothetical protein
MAPICYSPHPFCGHTVELVRWFRRQTSERLVVKLPEGVQIAIAAWMLAPLACRPLHDAPTPCVRGDARRARRDVLEHALVLHPTASATSGAAQRQGVREAPEPSQPPTASGGAALAPSHRLAAAPRAPTPAVPRPHGPAAHGPGARHTARGASPCVSTGVRRLGTVPLTWLSARPATITAVPTRKAHGAPLPSRTGPGPGASGRLS